MHDLQLADPSVDPAMSAVANTKKPFPDEVKAWSQDGRRLIQFWEFLMIKDGTLWLSIEVEQPNTGSFQLILPFSLREGVLEDLHSGAIGGHLGEEKMIGYLKERFYWPGCERMVQNMWKLCN